MSEETWQAARLIPTSGISGAEEQERRATSALLAVMSAVREFGRAITQPLGAPSGPVRTYIEVPFTSGDRRLYPDGLVRVTRGQREWTALVEVKTGSNELRREQLEDYLDIARERKFDALITVSNEMPPVPGQHPTEVDRRRLKHVSLHHLTWTEVLTEAVMQKEFRGVADPEQAWILGELIRYLEHPRSGALEFTDMGAAWVPMRDAVAAGTLRAGDAIAAPAAGRFDALLRYTCLRLGRQLGTEVTPALSRRDLADPATRLQALTTQLIERKTMTGAIRIPGAIGLLHVTADLRAGKIICHVDIEAPREGGSPRRVNWLVRQLKTAPDDVRLEAFVAHARNGGTAELLRRVRADPVTLIGDATKDLRWFRVARSTAAGPKRGTGRGAFIDSVVTAVDEFYELVLQGLRAWTPTAPRLRPTEEPVTDEPVPSSLIATAPSSQDLDLESEAPPVLAGRDAGGEPAGPPAAQPQPAAGVRLAGSAATDREPVAGWPETG